jgi:Ca2+-binding EF-hand superfamily protein
MLLQLQSQLQFFDQSAGLSRQEYDQFVMMMPAMVRQQYERIKTNFDDLDSNKDGVIDIGEFQGLVDRLVESNSD